MKKIILMFILSTVSVSAYAILPPDAGIIQVHDMQMLKQQRFRMEEINDYNDVKQEKERYQKRQQQTKPIIEKSFEKNSKFVEDNGEIKIKFEQ